MPKTKKSNLSRSLPVLYGGLIVLLVACFALSIALVHSTHRENKDTLPSISLGSMQYDFTSARAVKLTDASVNALKAFLQTDASHEGCPVGHPPYEHVAAYTKDETQVFIRYGCGAADSPIYAVKTNGAWKMLSPTNHFDGFDIPDCGYLDSYGISKEIAPVCANDVQVGTATGTPQYRVR